MITVLTILVGLAIMTQAAAGSAALAAQLPDVTMCDQTLPKVFFRGLQNYTAACGIEAKRHSTQAFGSFMGDGILVDGGQAGLSSRRALRALLAARDAQGRTSQRGRDAEREAQAVSQDSALASCSDDPYACETEDVNLYADPNAIAPFADPLVLTRQATVAARQKEDAACSAVLPGSYSVAFRYNFTGANYHALAWVSAPANAFTAGPAFGTVVPYGDPATACDPKRIAAAVAAYENATAKGMSLTAGIPPPEHPSCPDPRVLLAPKTAGGLDPGGLCPCAPLSSDKKCSNAPCFGALSPDDADVCKPFSAATLVGCYCLQIEQTYMTLKGANGFVEFSTKESDVCSGFLRTYVIAQVVAIISGIAVNVVNLFLQSFMPWLVAQESHFSRSQLYLAQSSRLGLAQSIITAFVALAVNAAPPNGLSKSSLPSFLFSVGVLTGSEPDFQTSWYSKVGNTVATTALTNVIIPPLLMLSEFLGDFYSRWTLRGTVGKVLTQDDMDELYVGGRFLPSIRFPLVLTMSFVSLLYGGGIPMLYPMAGLGFLLQYFTDKAMLLNFYRIPAALGADMARLTIRILPMAVLGHLLFTIWMFSTPLLMPSPIITPRYIRTASNYYLGAAEESTLTTTLLWWLEFIKARVANVDAVGALPRVLHLHTAPLLALVVVLVLVLTFSNVLYLIGLALYSLLFVLTCGFHFAKRLSRILGGHVSLPSKIAGVLSLENTFVEFEHRVEEAIHHVGHTRRVVPLQEVGGVPDSASPPLSARVSNAVGWILKEHLEAFPTYHALLSMRHTVVRGLTLEALFIRNIKKTPGGERACGTILRADGDSTCAGKGLGPYSKEFSRLHDASTRLSTIEVATGFRLQEIISSTLEDANASSAAFQYAVLAQACTIGVSPEGVGKLGIPGVMDGGGRPSMMRGGAGKGGLEPLQKAVKLYQGAASLARVPAAALVGFGAAPAVEAAANPEDDDQAMWAALLEEAEEAQREEKEEAELAAKQKDVMSKIMKRRFQAEGAQQVIGLEDDSGLTKAQQRWRLLRKNLRYLIAKDFKESNGLVPAGAEPPPAEGGGGQEDRVAASKAQNAKYSEDAPIAASGKAGGKRPPAKFGGGGGGGKDEKRKDKKDKAVDHTTSTIFILRQLWTDDPPALASTARLQGKDKPEMPKGLAVRKGRAMKTWEVLKRMGMHTYEMHHNPEYQSALNVAKLAQEEA